MKEDIKKTTEINWDKGRIYSEHWLKRISWLIVIWGPVKCHCSLFLDFENGDKNVKTFAFKVWENPVTLKKSFKTIERKLIISNSDKMQPLLNVSKAWQTIPIVCIGISIPSSKTSPSSFLLSPLLNLQIVQVPPF